MSHAKYHFDFLLVKNQNKCSSGILWVLKSTWCLRKGILQQLTISSTEADKFETEAKAWVTYFTSIYQSKNVTPYIHIMAMHIPEFIHKYRTWENFGGGKFWRINGSKVFGEEKFGESVGSILKILAFINIGGEKFGELPTVRQIRQNFPPPKFSHVRYTNLAQFNQQGMEKLNDQTTIDFARSINHNYRNLEALKQLLYKKNKMEHLEDNGFQHTPKPTKCSICKMEGHNKRTCKNKQ